MSSTFAVEVVPVTLEPHPNADSLSIVRAYGYQVIVRTADWDGVDRAAYVPPDSVVPDTPEYAFLDGHLRVKAKKLRGIWSMGLLVPAPEGAQIGDDVAAQLGITHYEPPLRLVSEPRHKGEGNAEPGPDGFYPKYDVENLRRYGQVLFRPGEPVAATEKVHGTSARFVYKDGRFYVASRNQWVREGDNLYWRALRQYPALETFLSENPGYCAYGEVYGWVQELRYGHKPGEVSLALFDILCDGLTDGCTAARIGAMPKEPHWVPAPSFDAICARWELPRVPIVYAGPFDMHGLEAAAEGPTVIGGGVHHREGIVVRPAYEERSDPRHGRALLKLVSLAYLEKAA